MLKIAIIVFKDAVLLALVSVLIYANAKGWWMPPLEMEWATETGMMAALACLYLFINGNAKTKPFFYYLKIIVLLALVTGLLFHLVTKPELARHFLLLIALLLALSSALAQLIGAFLVLYRKPQGYICLMAFVTGISGVLTASSAAFWQLSILAALFSVTALTDGILKGVEKNEKGVHLFL